MNPDEKPVDPDQVDEELTPDEIDGGDPDVDDAVNQIASAIREAAASIKAERDELYEGEAFDDGNLGFGSDLSAYDRTAYTRTRRETDYSSYRYNLEPTADVVQGELDAISYEVDEYGNPLDPSLDADGVPVTPAKGKTYGSYGYGSSWGGYGGSWGSWSGGWQSAWYSGYSSAERAIEGVHDHVETFITAPGFEALEIVPDLEAIEMLSIANDGTREPDRYSLEDTMKTLIVRIDSCLYEKLGISEAQQHYIVDGISQVLAAQSFPDPFLVTLLQGAPRSFHTFIPNVVREITTEMMRAKGLSLLLEEMPGWLKRVNAFRSAMYVHEPKEGEVATAYLMYAIWEREAIETIEHQDAVETIEKIEALLLENAYDYGVGDSTLRTTHGREHVLEKINGLLCEYITSFGPAAVIVKRLKQAKEIFKTKLRAEDKSDPGFWSSHKEDIREICDELVPLIHDHNRTFQESSGVVKHLDAPECPNVSLLSETRRQRVEFSRKCLFNFKRLPLEIIRCGPEGDEDKYLKSGIKRINDMIGKMGSMDNLLKNAEKIISDKYKNGEGIPGLSPGERGNNATRHPELRSRSPIGGGTRREFRGEDPDFNRNVIIFDSTLKA